MEKIRWIDRVRDGVLQRGKDKGNIIHTVNRRKVDWVSHILCRNCLLKHVIERKIEVRLEVTGRRRKRRKQLLDDLTEMRGCWKLKTKTPNRVLWITRFGRGCRSVVSQIAPVMDARTNA
jgi:hypothetical protein